MKTSSSCELDALAPLQFDLGQGGLLCLDRALGWRIVCRAGRLLISTVGRRGAAGCDIDLPLDAHYLIDSPGRVLVEAVGPATVGLIVPLPRLIGCRGAVALISPNDCCTAL